MENMWSGLLFLRSLWLDAVSWRRRTQALAARPGRSSAALLGNAEPIRRYCSEMKLEFNTNEQDEIIAQYLNTEFEILNQRALQYEQGVATKTNFYLAILTAAAGGIVIAFTQSNLPAAFLLSATIIVLIFLLVLGSITLSQTLDMLATAIFLYRRAGRIRRWFLDYAPKLLPYFPFVVADDSPPYLIKRSKLRGIESALLLSNAALAGIILAFGQKFGHSQVGGRTMAWNKV